jgi:nucleoside-diphosphate-sugar epimerase
LRNILVVGYSGLIGQEIIKALSNLDYSIYGINSKTTRDSKQDIDNVIHICINEIEKYDFSFIILALQNSAFKYDLNANLTSNLVYDTEKAVKCYLVRNPKSKLILLSSISIYGEIQILNDLNLFPKNPTKYAMYKLRQEQIFNLETLAGRTTVLRLPAILCKDSVNHFPARVISRLKINEDVSISNPDRLWNSCLLSDDLMNIILKTVNGNRNLASIVIPHAHTALSILDIVRQMKQELRSRSTIRVKSSEVNGGIANIMIDSKCDVMSVKDSITLYTRMNY